MISMGIAHRAKLAKLFHKYLSRGVLPENLRRGPYAVVERA